MLKNKIGENAGKVWSALFDKKEIPVRDVKHGLQMSDKDLWMAVGWLARENKTALSNPKEIFVISLNNI